jgi:hypothetical protein
VWRNHVLLSIRAISLSVYIASLHVFMLRVWRNHFLIDNNVVVIIKCVDYHNNVVVIINFVYHFNRQQRRRHLKTLIIGCIDNDAVVIIKCVDRRMSYPQSLRSLVFLSLFMHTKNKQTN